MYCKTHSSYWQLLSLPCSVALAQLYVFSLLALGSLSWAKRCWTSGQLCTGMLVYCTHTCTLTRPLDMLTDVVCMSSPNCWLQTVSMELTTIVGWKGEIKWLNVAIPVHFTKWNVDQRRCLPKQCTSVELEITVGFNSCRWVLLTSLHNAQWR